MSAENETELPLVEQELVRVNCFHPTGTFVEFCDEEIENSIPQRFEKIVAQRPDDIAVSTLTETLTYRELNQRSNRIAGAVQQESGEKNQNVALLLEQGAAPIAAMMGVLKAGKAYVPLEPYYPMPRLQFMLQDSMARMIVTNNKNFSLARELGQHATEFINIDSLESAPATDDPHLSRSPDSIAYVMYTSGSTGQPKGVMQTDRNVLHEIMNYTNAAHICGNDRLLLVSSPSFGDAVRTIYVGLLNGARLCPLDLKACGFESLPNWITRESITVYRSVPTVFRHFVSGLTGNDSFPDLRLIYLAGDTVLRKDVELYKKHFSARSVLINGLGTTESLTFRWYFIGKETQINGSSVPVGYGLKDKHTLLLDDEGKAAGANVVGEIAIKSRYLSPGYWGRPDLTQRAFTNNPTGAHERIYRTGDIGIMRSDGCLEHLGRKDFQVKVRGYRIELTEIETALLSLDNVKEAVAVGHQDGSGETRLTAYFVPTRAPAPTVSVLRRALAEKLPNYMVPSAFVCLEALPVSTNGKVDRRALPVPNRSRPNLDTAFVAPGNPVERELIRIWSEVLGVDEIGVHDEFLDLGGYSLAAIRIISKLIKTFQLELPLQSVFQSPTVAQMAAVITAHQGKKIGEPELERLLSEFEAISEENAKQLLADATKRR